MTSRLTIPALLITALASLPVLAGQPPENDLAFARFLLGQGKQAQAMIEFERCRFAHKGHAAAAEAAFQAARLAAACDGDLEHCRELLGEASAADPRSPLAQRSRELLALVDANAEADGKPLQLYFSAELAGERGDDAAALDACQKLCQAYPRSGLVDEALFIQGRLQIERLDQPKDGLRTFQALLDRNPRSGHANEIYYLTAVAVEKIHGPGQEAIQAYDRVARRLPDTTFAKMAGARIEEIRRSHSLIERQFPARGVRTYAVLDRGYLEGRAAGYRVRIRVDRGISEEDLTATMEDALLAHYLQRPALGDRVRVDAYYDYPDAPAGHVTWQANASPRYVLRESPAAVAKGEQPPPEPKEPKEVVRDIFIELLKEGLKGGREGGE